jgi:hypothetical protein
MGGGGGGGGQNGGQEAANGGRGGGGGHPMRNVANYFKDEDDVWYQKEKLFKVSPIQVLV